MRDRLVLSLIGMCLFTSASPLNAQQEYPQIEGWGELFNHVPRKDWKLEEGKLHLTASDKVSSLSVEMGRLNAPVVLVPQKGDFRFEVCVEGEFAPGARAVKTRTPYQGAGIFLFSDPLNYIRLERATLTSQSGDQHYTVFEDRVKGRPTRFARTSDAPLKPGIPTWLRVKNPPPEAVALMKA